MIMRVLIVGGGIGGMSMAIALRQRGIAVDLIEIDPQWRVYGAGITITSPTFRAFEQLGVLDDVLDAGFSGRGIQVCSIAGEPLYEVSDPEGMPGSGGIMRPSLHRILSEQTLALGTSVKLGRTVSDIADGPDSAIVTFDDGQRDVYDLVIGADGLFSRTRQLCFPNAPKPTYTGQTVWRVFLERPANINRRHYFLGGHLKVGLSPVSDRHLYLFALESTPQHPILPDSVLPGMLKDLLAGYSGIVGDIRESINDSSPIVVRPLEAFLLTGDWYRGRVLLIGDAAHPTTPQLASGAGMAVEDAIVLAQEIDQSRTVTDTLARYQKRRDARCRLVVNNSLEIGRLESLRASPEEQTKLVTQSLTALAQPV